MILGQLITAPRLQSFVDANVKLYVAFEPEFEVMIAGKFFLGRDGGELNHHRLFEDFVRDFVGVGPGGFRRVVDVRVLVLVAAAFFVRLGRFGRGAFVARLGRVFLCRTLIARLLFGSFALGRFPLRQKINVERLR